MIFGVDVSNHQSHFDFGAARAEGYDFAIIKCSQGDWFTDARYAQHSANAAAAGLLVAAYHYQGTQYAGAQVQLIRSVVPPGTPVIIDVEEGSGGADITRGLVAALVEAGHHVPLVYIPRWYWSGHLGFPDLSGLPPLWISRYPDYMVRRKEGALTAALDLTRGSLFDGHGGLPATIAQITSSGAVADYPGGSIDLNVYAGTREELSALLFGTATDDITRSMDMGLVGIVNDDQSDRLYALFANTDGLAKLHIDSIETAENLRALGVREVTVRQGWINPIHDHQDTAAGIAERAIEDMAATLGVVEARLLDAIREIPAGPSGDIDYDEVERRVRACFRDAAFGPAGPASAPAG